MNIYIPHNWLIRFLKTNATYQDIQSCLSLSGPSVERIEMIAGEPVYLIEVTTNRVDCMSVYGIAREAAAILPHYGFKASLITHKLPHPNNHAYLDLSIKNDPRLCHRILAVKFENVSLKPSPKWMQKRLIQVGQRPLNNIIDITNFCMWETGHPMHAFDYDRLINKTVIVREAKKGEQITTLDGIKHTLNGGEVVFDNGKGEIIDLPGIMGTKNTVVNNNTKNVLLWIESIVSRKIRDASMGLVIRSQAAVLNEKGVDPELGLKALLRGIDLFQKLTGTQPASQLIDIYPNKPEIKDTVLQQQLIDNYLGIKLNPKKITRILTDLGCQVIRIRSGYRITPSSWRANDLQIPQDYIEEIARIHGYHNLNGGLMNTAIPSNPTAAAFSMEHNIKNYLSDWGIQEVFTYSMVSQKLVQQSGFSLSKHLKIKNPFSNDWAFMRRSLIPSHLLVLNDNKNLDSVQIFEISNVYHPRNKNLPEEELHLTITTNTGYTLLKGILDTLFRKLYLDKIQIIPMPGVEKPFINGKSAEIYASGKFLGYIGQVNDDSVKPTFSLQILLKQLLSIARTYPEFIPNLNTPPILEDLTFTVPERTYLGELIETIKNTHKYIEIVNLKSHYNRNFTFTITYRSPDRSLSVKDINPIRKKIVSLLLKNFKAKLVGSV